MPSYLARIEVDPWGDGKQTFGYVLIKDGLPDGSDRPMVYSRRRSRDGLFYFSCQPTYGFYSDTKQGGQFLDVVRWETTTTFNGPATQALP